MTPCKTLDLGGSTFYTRPSSKAGVDEPFSANSLSFSFSTTLSLHWLILERGLFFFAFIRVYNSWLNFVVIFTERETIGKLKEKKRRRKGNGRKTIHLCPKMTYFSLPGEWHERRNEKASVLNSDELRSEGQPTRQNCLSCSCTL